MNIKFPCSKEYKASRESGYRPSRDIKWVVLHSTEGSTARSAAIWFSNPIACEKGGPCGSAHIVVDDNECYRTLSDSRIPWGAKGTNKKGLHIEHAGYAKWSFLSWYRHLPTLRRGAYRVAKWCYDYHIPATWLSSSDLFAGKSGITSHRNCSKAFGGSHWDPGPFFPRRLYMRYVRNNLKEMKSV